MQIIDIFSGIGGFSLAGHWMGWRTIQFCEIDPWCHKILKKHWPNVPIHTDIKTLTSGIIRQNPLYDENEKTILTAGVPCQPASTAGKRRGESDERWIWPQTIKFIGEFRPTIAVLENVAGLVSMENGKTLDGILSDLEDEGYTTEQVIIPACAVGAWHRRDRIWIIAYNQSQQSSARIIGEHSEQEQGKFRGMGSKANVSDPRLLGSEINEEQTAEVVKCGKDVSDSKRTRTGENHRGIQQGISGISGREETGKEDVPDRNNQGLQGRSETRDLEGIRTERNQESERCGEYIGGASWLAEPGVCGMVNGLPPELDGYWSKEPEGIPRFATGVKNRVDRLKGLGNAIVPQVVLEIFKTIEQLNI